MAYTDVTRLIWPLPTEYPPLPAYEIARVVEREKEKWIERHVELELPAPDPEWR